MSPVADVQVEAAPAGFVEFPSDKSYKTLPASWFTSEQVYELERRAIYSKTWLAVCHISRLQEGVPHKDTIAGFKFSVVKGSDGTVTAYRGHGPAPGQTPVHVYLTDPGSLIFVNFDLSGTPRPFEECYEGVLDVLRQFDFGSFSYHTEYTWDGSFNWKCFVDGYSECYHCAIGHPALAKDFILDSYKVTCHPGWMRHSVDRKPANDAPKPGKQTAKDSKASSGSADGAWLFFFPNLALNIYSPSISIQRFVPVSATETRMDIAFYRREGVATEEIDAYVEFAKVVDREDFDLVLGAQENVNRGIYNTGLLHPFREAGVIHYQVGRGRPICRERGFLTLLLAKQGEVRKMLTEHAKLESTEGREIWPAGQE